jgi:hypothetical protein
LEGLIEEQEIQTEDTQIDYDTLNPNRGGLPYYTQEDWGIHNLVEPPLPRLDDGYNTEGTGSEASDSEAP